MSDDPYQSLGIGRTATAKQIRNTFLKLAKNTHPDLNPGDVKAEGRFKAANAAHELLSDPERRLRFDCGGVDAAGHEAPPSGPPPGERRHQDYAEGAVGPYYGASFGPGNDHDLGDIFSILSGARSRGSREGGINATR